VWFGWLNASELATARGGALKAIPAVSWAQAPNVTRKHATTEIRYKGDRCLKYSPVPNSESRPELRSACVPIVAIACTSWRVVVLSLEVQCLVMLWPGGYAIGQEHAGGRAYRCSFFRWRSPAQSEGRAPDNHEEMGIHGSTNYCSLIV